MKAAVRNRLTAIVALGAVLLAAGAAREPAATPQELEMLAAPFAFEQEGIGDPVRAGDRRVREVNPALDHIQSWISSVGAGIAMGDVTGTGLPDDVCLVDPRADLPTVRSVAQPAPYAPVVLDPAPLPYDGTMAPMGCVLADVNADGRTDAIVHHWGRSPVVHLQAPPRDGTPVFVAQEVVEPYEVWNTNTLTTADIDGDGLLDLVVGNYFPDEARILDPAAHDDPHVQMQDSMSRAVNGGRNRVLRAVAIDATSSPPHVHFSDVPEAFPGDLGTGWTLALAAADLDGDLLPELHVANDFGPDHLFHNRSTPGTVRLEPVTGARSLTTPSSKVLGRGSFKGMGADFGDLTGDGLLDLFVSNIAADFALHESHHAFVHTGDMQAWERGRAPYRDDSEPLGLSRSGWAWDVKLADLDNSGSLEVIQAMGFVRGTTNRWPELHELAMGNDRLLHRPEVWPRFRPGDDLSGSDLTALWTRGDDGRFHDIAALVGLGDPLVTRGIAIADLDGSGGLDVALANQWGQSLLLRNRCDCGSFLGLDLLLPVGDASEAPQVLEGRRGGDLAGRPAIGAQVVVHTADGRRIAQVDGGSGHTGQREPGVHIGLGEDQPLRIDVRYRDNAGVVRELTLPGLTGWHTVLLESEEGVG